MGRGERNKDVEIKLATLFANVKNVKYQYRTFSTIMVAIYYYYLQYVRTIC